MENKPKIDDLTFRRMEKIVQRISDSMKELELAEKIYNEQGFSMSFSDYIDEIESKEDE